MKKKLLILLLAGCMACALSACGEEKKEQTEEAANETAAEETEIDMSALGTSTVKKLGTYKGLVYVPMEVSVTEAEVDAYVESMRQNQPELVDAETATEDSIVNIDYAGKKDGVAFDGGTAQGKDLDIANSHFIPGFAESIVGMKVGETKDCPMTFPENYHTADLAGQEVVFTITLNSCKDRVVLELDEFVVSQGYKDVEEMRTAVREMYLTTRQQEADADREYQLMEKLIAGSEFDIKDAEVDIYYQQVIDQQEELVKQYYGIDLETYVLAYLGMMMEDFEADCKETALFRLQSTLLKREVAKAEGMEISEEEYEAGMQTYMPMYGYTEISEFEKAIGKENLIDQFLIDKAEGFIAENAVPEE